MDKSCNDFKNFFVQKEYGRKPTFSGFLPGIAGPWGIPTWCNYNNRGQAVCSFGIQDKDHSIMEFTAASTSYRCVSQIGFRTFIKQNETITEPFSDGLGDLIIEQNSVTLQWRNSVFSIEVVYCTLPEERMAGLCRKLKVQNISSNATEIELLDGLARIVPYGIDDEKLKQEPNLSTAWVIVDNIEEHTPFFGVRASLEDTSRISEEKGRNFGFAFKADMEHLPMIVQPDLVFGWDSSLSHPIGFKQTPLLELLKKNQLAENYQPCCMTAWQGTLSCKESIEIWEFYGQARDITEIEKFCKKATKKDYFECKLAQARALTNELCGNIRCRTANPAFDGYIEQSFLDNVMRGGFPFALGDYKNAPPVYLYSRKHGDPEREYNKFHLDNTYFSQGNANFRDICQNRRSDVLFHPNAGRFNIKLFFELLQTDGYNPLEIEPTRFIAQHPSNLCNLVDNIHREMAQRFFESPFTVGELAMNAEHWNVSDCNAFIATVVSDSHMEPNAIYKTGYWSDHWTYLLDLIETEVSVHPERTKELLFGEEEYRWFSSCAQVLPQAKRYSMTPNGPRQYRCVEIKEPKEKWAANHENGKTIFSTLFEKLLLLCAIKSATLDISGAAIEMEGGKPGWNDALNGLPALFGASLSEGCELLRLLDKLLEWRPLYPKSISIHEEIANLLESVSSLSSVSNIQSYPTYETRYNGWIERNQIRDNYRERTKNGFSGRKKSLSSGNLIQKLTVLSSSLRTAIKEALTENNGMCPTYYFYEAKKMMKVEGGMIPLILVKKKLPLFLEAPSHFLLTKQSNRTKMNMVSKIRKSGLYDSKLHMYRLNEPLEKERFEIGRIKAFPNGWLENASIWLHMEYKYLLAMLKSNLYEQFFKDFNKMVIPFLSTESYGRSTMENSSFIVSSAYRNPAMHGRGFVSRLSGSTAEIISMWNIMLFGKKPFRYDGTNISLHFQPAIPDYLIKNNQSIIGTFLGIIEVEYHIHNLKKLIPGEYIIASYVLDSNIQIKGETIPEKWTKKIRSRNIEHIDVFIEPRH